MSQADAEPGLVDTNVFIYAHDPADPDKQGHAVGLVARLAVAGDLIVSAQVLNEFYSRGTHPGKRPSLSHEAGARIVHDIAASARVLPLTAATTLRALKGRAEHGLSWWDALLWATAKENGVALIYTEDLPGRSEVEGVRYVNPLTGEAAGAREAGD